VIRPWNPILIIGQEEMEGMERWAWLLAYFLVSV
jgi:hypothetical protein